MADKGAKERDVLVPSSNSSSGQRTNKPPAIHVGADRPPDPFPDPSPGPSPRGSPRGSPRHHQYHGTGGLGLQRSNSDKGSREHVALLPPEITYDTVATAPNSPTDPGLMGGSAFGSFTRATHSMQSRSTSVTPSGSLLCVSKPIELRESTLTINYPDTGGLSQSDTFGGSYEHFMVKGFSSKSYKLNGSMALPEDADQNVQERSAANGNVPSTGGSKEDKQRAGSLVRKKHPSDGRGHVGTAQEDGRLKPPKSQDGSGSDSTSGISIDLEGVTVCDTTTDTKGVVHVDSILVPEKGLQGACIQVDAEPPEVQVVGGRGMPVDRQDSTDSSLADLTNRKGRQENMRKTSLAGGLCGLGRSLEHAIASHAPPPQPIHHVGGNPDDDGEVSLLYSRHEKIPMKDFGAEIRASMDVENFLNQAVLLLDVADASTDAILERMLQLLLTNEEPNTSIDEAKRAIFTHDSVHKLAKTIQGTCITYNGSIDYDQSWICVLCTMPTIQKRHVAIARLRSPANLGSTSQEVYFLILVVAPTKEKGTKNALETGRTFATLFADMELRQRLLAVHSEDEFKKLLWEHTKELADEQSHPNRKSSNDKTESEENDIKAKSRCLIGRGLRQDFWRRLPHYIDDYKDGVLGHRTLQKTAATTVFLYFACVLPSIAFGMLNDNNTHGKIDVKKVLYSQTLGGLIFALIGGQPMTILLTTAPLALYTKVIYKLAEQWGVEFFAMYACVGLWNMFFLLIYSLFGLSSIMKWCTRSTEEIFSLFIAIAFSVDAIRDVHGTFVAHYCTAPSNNHNSTADTLLTTMSALLENTTLTGEHTPTTNCMKEVCLLYLILMLGTLWIGISLFNFTKTPYLNAGKREILADYALPASVLVMSFVGSYLFRDVKLEPFNYMDTEVFAAAPLEKLTWVSILGSLGLGFCLSLLFFMDQNISSAMVNNPANKLKKGPAYHWDLMVIGLLNGVLCFFGLPMVHGALPHSPLHVRALADVEDYVEQGHVYQKIVRVRETRLTAILSHILIGLSMFLLPYPMSYIPRPVLDGLFLYLAVSALGGNQMFERILLLLTEQAAYPPNHYIRSVPQRKVHFFTGAQILQLAVMCGIGFSPIAYMKMVFPVVIFLLLPIRHKLIPYLIDKKFLEALDG